MGSPVSDQGAPYWTVCADRIRSLISPQSYEAWVRPIQAGSLANHRLTLIVPNQFVIDWLREHYLALLTEELRRASGDQQMELAFQIQTALPVATTPQTDVKKVERRQNPRLSDRYTFHTFVVGSGNQFAHAASRKVAEQPGVAYNPLFLYGGVGLGKTHLLNAIGNYIMTQSAATKVCYISAEQFTNEVINSIRYDKTVEFRNRYRNVDVLLIDDIQFIAGKERTQEEFFHTFNSLYEMNKQIVISSDRSAKEMSDIEERLRSRFEMGLTADIQPPDLETRLAILRRKSEGDHMALAGDVALFLATHIKSNIRELEGALIRIGAVRSLTGEEITIDMARRVLRDTIKEVQRDIAVDEVQRAVAERFHIKISEIKSKKRSKNLVFPRQIAMYLCRELTKLSFPEIGRHFGGKDHSTVIYACRQIEELKQHDQGLETLLTTLAQALKE
ncbi:MAG: chromosomal replication initiator protein DnaA [Nitrospirae bacterium]|nr:chromosomal replication initiator protein DnaA [Nitrospirota bacterium]